jgi:hypothetical protein
MIQVMLEMANSDEPIRQVRRHFDIIFQCLLYLILLESSC